jgi:DNA-binding GntR family transcriptional regulator
MHTKPTTTAHGIADQLRDALNAGRWSPGAPLRQEELAEEFSVSRIPVREALSKLHAEGLVVIHPNRGAYVATFTEAQMREIFDLRVLLECEALRHAVHRHTPQSLRQIEAIQHALDAADDKLGWARGDRAFHDALYAPSARERTLQLINGLRGSIERFYLARLTPDSRRSGWRDEHQRLIAAVKARDMRAAQRELTDHLRQTEALALDTLATSAPA